jgi:KRAB domain-containing zinc finger protein
VKNTDGQSTRTAKPEATSSKPETMTSKSETVISKPDATIATNPQCKSLECLECGHSYKHKASLVRHMKQHAATRLPRCHACHQYFRSEADRVSHNSQYHRDAHLCTDCGKSFIRKSSLNLHMKTHNAEAQRDRFVQQHTGPFDVNNSHRSSRRKSPKSHACKKCGRAFTSVRYLHIHVKRCEDNVAYRCSVCSKEFSSPSALGNHSRAEHDKSIFRCSMCGKVYKYQPA